LHANYLDTQETLTVLAGITLLKTINLMDILSAQGPKYRTATTDKTNHQKRKRGIKVLL